MYVYTLHALKNWMLYSYSYLVRMVHVGIKI